MAGYFGRYTEALAAAGKQQLALPMYVNGWLRPQAGQPTAGQYPSGGPAKRVPDICNAAVSSLDLLAPDIYASDAKAPLADYDHAGNPVLVPKAKFKTGSILWALGQHAALGYSVFSVEDGRVDSQFTQALDILNPMTAIITRAQQERCIAAVLLDDGKQAVSRSAGIRSSFRGPRRC